MNLTILKMLSQEDLQNIECDAYRDLITEIVTSARGHRQSPYCLGYASVRPLTSVSDYVPPFDSVNWSGSRRSAVLELAEKQMQTDGILDLSPGPVRHLSTRCTLPNRPKGTAIPAWLDDARCNILMQPSTVVQLYELDVYLTKRKLERENQQEHSSRISPSFPPVNTLGPTTVNASKPQQPPLTKNDIPATGARGGNKRPRASSISSNSSSGSNCSSIEEILHPQFAPNNSFPEAALKKPVSAARLTSGPATKKQRFESSPAEPTFDIFDVPDSPGPNIRETPADKVVLSRLQSSPKLPHTDPPKDSRSLLTKTPNSSSVSSSTTPTFTSTSTSAPSPRPIISSIQDRAQRNDEVNNFPAIPQNSPAYNTQDASQSQIQVMDDERIKQKLKEHPWITEKLEDVARSYPDSHLYLKWEDNTLQVGCRDCPGRYFRINTWAGSLQSLYKHLPGQSHIKNAKLNNVSSFASIPSAKRLQKLVDKQSPKPFQSSTLASTQQIDQVGLVESSTPSIPFILRPPNSPSSNQLPSSHMGAHTRPNSPADSVDKSTPPRGLPTIQQTSLTQPTQLGNAKISMFSQFPIEQEKEIAPQTDPIISDAKVPKNAAEKVADVQQRVQDQVNLTLDCSNNHKNFDNRLVILEKANDAKFNDVQAMLVSMDTRLEDREKNLHIYLGQVNNYQGSLDMRLKNVESGGAPSTIGQGISVTEDITQLHKDFTTLNTRVNSFATQVQNLHQNTIWLPAHVCALEEQVEMLKDDTSAFKSTITSENKAFELRLLEMEKGLEFVQQKVETGERSAVSQKAIYDRDIKEIHEESRVYKEAAASQNFAYEKEITALRKDLGALSDLKLAHNEAMLETKKQHAKEINALQKTHNEKMLAARNKHRDQISELSQTNNSVLGDVMARLVRLEQNATTSHMGGFKSMPVVHAIAQAGVSKVNEGLKTRGGVANGGVDKRERGPTV